SESKFDKTKNNTQKMKKLVLSAALLGLLFTGCSNDDDNNGNTQPPQEGVIAGEITSDQTFEFGTYVLDGIVRIKSGATATFDAGSTITANMANGVDAIVVENGGRL